MAPGALGVFVTLALAAFAPSFASAAAITVTTTDESSATDCTLPDAMRAANLDSVQGQCSAGSGTDVITITATGVIDLSTALPVINSDMTIDGQGIFDLNVRRQSAAPDMRLFTVQTGKTVTISDMTISNGRFQTFSQAGAGVASFGTLTMDHTFVAGNVINDTEDMTSGGPAPTGGGIANFGTMTLRDSRVEANSVIATNTGTGNASADATGGGIINFGTMTIERSTIANNHVIAGVTSNDPGASAFAAGAGVRNWVTTMGGNLAIHLSTISGNTTQADAPAPAFTTRRGGGIYNFFGPLTLDSDTLAFNTATVGANLAPQATETVRDTLISNPVDGDNCDNSNGNSVNTDGGFNLTFPSTCAGLNALTGDPNLLPLAENGGPTETHELGAGSAAYDQGKAGPDTADQRGKSRPVDIAGIPNAATGDGSDIGALEAQDDDADGVPEGTDRCPAISSATQSGCPEAARALTLKYSAKRERFTGKLTATGPPECVDSKDVSIFRKVNGPDKHVGDTTTKPSGKYKLAKHAKRGKYYSSVDQTVVPNVAQCEAATSPVKRVR
jgi:hypothetical protein